MIGVIWPTIVATGIAAVFGLIWVANPRLQRNEVVRLGLIVSVFGTVGLGLMAGVEIVGRVMAFGLADAF